MDYGLYLRQSESSGKIHLLYLYILTGAFSHKDTSLSLHYRTTILAYESSFVVEVKLANGSFSSPIFISYKHGAVSGEMRSLPWSNILYYLYL